MMSRERRADREKGVRFYAGIRAAFGLLNRREKMRAALLVLSMNVNALLGLADVVTAEAGGARVETLFVDEGFGSLDEETLQEVMDTLDGLRSGGRVVGLVSHVPDLRAEHYADDYHLTPEGAAIYTRHFTQEIASNVLRP